MTRRLDDAPGILGRPTESIHQLQRLISLLRPHWGRIVRGFGLGLAVGVIALVPPLFAKALFDDVYPSRDPSLLLVVVLGMVTVEVASSMMNALRGYYTQVVGARVSSELSLLYFNHIQHLPTSFFDTHSVGEIISRSGDLQRSVSFVTNAFKSVLVNGIYLVLIPPLLIAFNWQLAALALVTIPVTTCVSLLTGRRLRRLARSNMELNAEASAFQVETLGNIRLLKAAAAEPDMFLRMKRRLVSARTAALRTGALGALLGAGNALVRTAGTALFSWWAWTLILQGRLSLGGLVAFSAYRGYLTGPVGEIASMFIDFQQTTVSLARFFEYFDVPTEQDPAGSITARQPIQRRLAGAIEFRGVHFEYEPDRPVLTNAFLKVSAGEIVAIVGKSGAGKSSIIKLLLRMYEPYAGIVYLDGTPLSAFSLPELRRQIGVVWQDNSALRGTLRENLTLGADSASDGELYAALRQAQLDEFVRDLPAGLDSAVAEWGGTLSGGQRQRLSIARALARSNAVLLLDEATSNLDTETERAILGSIFANAGRRTVIFATHRLAAARLADRVYFVAQQTVTGGLPHPHMMDENAEYRALWEAGSVPVGVAAHADPDLARRGNSAAVGSS